MKKITEQDKAQLGAYLQGGVQEVEAASGQDELNACHALVMGNISQPERNIPRHWELYYAIWRDHRGVMQDAGLID